MKQSVLLLIIVLFSQSVVSQSNSRIQIKGQVIDKDTREILSSATVVCLRTNDSSKVSLGFTDRNGLFFLDSLLLDRYFLYITFLGYQSLKYPVEILPESSVISLGTIEMTRIGFKLTQIEVVENRIPARIGADTLEFNASYFKTRNNGSVEDLLKNIPGVQIDRDGTIRINGEIVRTIMVNGRSLFGEDPKNVTRNLQSDLIDKIQVVDRSSDQKKSNNVSNGSGDRVINLTIKESKRNLISGEVTAAYGTTDRFAMKTNISRFREKQQLLLLGNGDNINGALDSKYIGDGVRNSWSIGTGYNEDISKKITINASYMMNFSRNIDQRNSLKQSIAADSGLLYNQESYNKLTSRNHSASLTFEFKMDSIQKITLSGQFSLLRSSVSLTNHYESTTHFYRILNNGYFSNNKDNSNLAIYGGLNYERKFSKRGRFLDVSFSTTKSNNSILGYAISENSYFPVNGRDMRDTINQHGDRGGDLRQFFFLISYTEPICADGYINFIFAEDHLISTADRFIWNYDIQSEHYDKLIDSLSNKFISSPVQHYAKMRWLYRKSRFDYSIAFATLFYKMRGRNVSLNNIISKDIVDFLPEINFSYVVTKDNRFRFSYRKTAEFPEISQLQPVYDYSDPLYVKTGNQYLRPMNLHNISISYSGFDVRKLQSFSTFFDAKFMTNQIVEATRIDSLGRQVVQPVNLSGSYFLSFRMINDFSIGNRLSSFYLNTTAVLRHDLSNVNDRSFFSNNLLLTQSIKFKYKNKELYDFTLSGDVSYNNIQYSIQDFKKVAFLNGGFTVAGGLNLPFALFVEMDFYLGWSQGRMSGYNAMPMMLNCSISKSLFPRKKGLIQLQGFDLLKQNISMNRNVGTSYIEDVKTNVLQRFLILKFSYFLGKN